jgi:ketosteroid isomerase-like protein
MGPIRNLWLAAVLIALRTSAASGHAASRKDEPEKFNNHLRELHLEMDTAGIFALWADDGVVLMPGEAPMIGKKVMQARAEDILTKMRGYKVKKEEIEFHDIQVSGDWASEWGLEHQVVQPPDGKEPIEARGGIALVLHREANGQWRIKQEMWNAAAQQ